MARRLGADVYRLLFAGELDGGPGTDRLVYISEVSVDAYLKRHGFGNASNTLSNEPRRTCTDDAGRRGVDKPADLHQRGCRRTKPDRCGPRQSGS